MVALAIACRPARLAFVRADEIDQTKALKIEAAYLYNFGKFIEWPSASFKTNEAPFVIGVLGEDPFGDILDSTVSSKTLQGHAIKIRRLRWNHADRSALVKCHILYICRSEQARLREILAAIHGDPVLAVSSLRDFASLGGMIGLVLEDGHIVFEVNLSALHKSTLKTSSKLLNLARIVEPDHDERR